MGSVQPPAAAVCSRDGALMCSHLHCIELPSRNYHHSLTNRRIWPSWAGFSVQPARRGRVDGVSMPGYLIQVPSWPSSSGSAAPAFGRKVSVQPSRAQRPQATPSDRTSMQESSLAAPVSRLGSRSRHRLPDRWLGTSAFRTIYAPCGGKVKRICRQFAGKGKTARATRAFRRSWRREAGAHTRLPNPGQRCAQSVCERWCGSWTGVPGARSCTPHLARICSGGRACVVRALRLGWSTSGERASYVAGAAWNPSQDPRNG
jgi:hypothetical protein